ncbi:MAG: orotate phosphoribosyltransferase [Alphaproteobacteria bacterium]|nr:orotate phosphoribosyltransferase [Alphaproteobacteria bacterium]
MARPDRAQHTSDEARLAAADTARHLLNIGAVNFRPEDPYTFTSGRVSPSYIDCRRVIAFPEAREAMTSHAVALIDREIGRDNIDVIAGGETAGIPYAAFVAVALGKSMVYVRKEPKGFGRMAQIEGALEDNTRVLLVEDLTTDGGSKVRFIDTIREAGATVEHTYVVFNYGIFTEAWDTMDKLGVGLHALATWWDVLDAARENSVFSAGQLDSVEEYLSSPDTWKPMNS